MDELDYQEPLPFEFLVYVAPEAVWRADMRRFRERFRSAPQTRDFFAFLKGTDGLLHIRGPRRLEAALESLDRILREIQEWCGRETEIVLFSDHGMNLEENRRIHLQTHLRRHGFKVTDHLRERRSIAIPAFGLCGYAALYCTDDVDASRAAEAITGLEGVDFAIHRDGANAILLRGERGVARIHRRANGVGIKYRYEQIENDPLQLAATVKSIRDEGQMDEQGFAPDQLWYERTAAHIYPDALSNLYQSLHEPRVHHTADVLLSLHDGYYYGMSFFSRFIRLAATHGNALRASTSAFMMSTHRAFPAHVRASDAQPFLKG
jgi:hypothetical protein